MKYPAGKTLVMCVSPKHSLCVHVRLCFATEFLLITSITVQWVYHQRVPYPSTTSPPSFCDTWQAKSPQGKKTRFTGLRADEVCVWRRYVVCNLHEQLHSKQMEGRWQTQKEEKPPKSTSRKPSTNQLINSFFPFIANNSNNWSIIHNVHGNYFAIHKT